MTRELDRIREILATPVPVSLATADEGGPHLVGVWNDDVDIVDDRTWLIPVHGMRKTEANINNGSAVSLLVASKQVKDVNSAGMGYRVTADAVFHYSGESYDRIKLKFGWARAAMGLSITKIERLI